MQLAEPIHSYLDLEMDLLLVLKSELFRHIFNNSPLKIGSLSFGCSDLILCFHTFVQEVPNGKLIIMITYYLAQMGIALSVVDSSLTKKNK